MPVELLEAIVKKELPVTVSDSLSIDKLRVLRAAHLIEADIPTPGAEGSAVVYQITFEGKSLLERIRTERNIA